MLNNQLAYEYFQKSVSRQYHRSYHIDCDLAARMRGIVDQMITAIEAHPQFNEFVIRNMSQHISEDFGYAIHQTIIDSHDGFNSSRWSGELVPWMLNYVEQIDFQTYCDSGVVQLKP